MLRVSLCYYLLWFRPQDNVNGRPPAYPDYRFGSTDLSVVYISVLLANIINMALDIMIFILPIPLLFRSDTLRNTKIGLLALFGLGVV